MSNIYDQAVSLQIPTPLTFLTLSIHILHNVNLLLA